MFRGKIGTDKPIEIFIALFVILAVAMVILKMFSSQIEQKREEMERQQMMEKAKQVREDISIYCASQCSRAYKSLRSKADYCLSMYEAPEGFVDLNNNNVPDFTKELSRTMGTCEDRLYCAAFHDCGSLNMKTCKQIVCDFMERELNVGDLPDDDVALADKLVGLDSGTGEYKGYFQPGACWNEISGDEKKEHWFYYFLLMEDHSLVPPNSGNCFFKWGTCLNEGSNHLDSLYGDIWIDDCIPPEDMI